MLGVSLQKTTFKENQDVRFAIRLNNITNSEQTIESCPIALAAVAYDADGRLVGKNSDYDFPLLCRMIYEIKVLPHSCIFEEKTKDGYVNAFAYAYVHTHLNIGAYDIVFLWDGNAPTQKPPGFSLHITVE